jgi:hypothetical protein
VGNKVQRGEGGIVMSSNRCLWWSVRWLSVVGGQSLREAQGVELCSNGVVQPQTNILLDSVRPALQNMHLTFVRPPISRVEGGHEQEP